jgi:hypothetical protein
LPVPVAAAALWALLPAAAPAFARLAEDFDAAIRGFDAAAACREPAAFERRLAALWLRAAGVFLAALLAAPPVVRAVFFFALAAFVAVLAREGLPLAVFRVLAVTPFLAAPAEEARALAPPPELADFVRAATRLPRAPPETDVRRFAVFLLVGIGELLLRSWRLEQRNELGTSPRSAALSLGASFGRTRGFRAAAC